MTFVDRFGVESLPSDPTGNVTTTATGSMSVVGLPSITGGYSFVRVYRSDISGSTSNAYVLVAQLDSTQLSFVDRGQDLGGRLSVPTVPATAALRPRLDASLVIDPGAVLKMEGARIELGQGVQFIAEGTDDAPIVITSKLDDRSGAGGTFDTNSDLNASRPAPGNWGGIYVPSGADVTIDNVLIAFGGGVTRLDGTFRSFNVLELQQGTARVANSRFEFNGNGIGGQGPVDRFGRLNNEEAVVFARGTSPIFINNTFENNSTNGVGLLRSSAITLDSNSLDNEFQGDRGRRTGFIDRITTLDNNRGPLFRGNSFNNNDINGLEVRADNRARNTAVNTLSIEELRSDGLTVQSVWDDTDIVHVLFDGIFVSNLAHESGLRLLSSPTESLVVKLSGAGSNFDPLRGAGFTAGGFKSSIDDRVGGTIYVVGQPGFPVVITSLQDDTVGAGLRPDGKPQNDTNNDGIATIPRPGDYRGILLDQDSNDRNVVFTLELESPTAVAPGLNSTVNTSQVLGQLAANAAQSDENLRLGFVVKGVLGQAEDVDVYSFTGVAGSEVWIDIDNTSFTLDTIVELLDANGNLLARSDNSTTETAGTSSITTTSLIAPTRVNPLVKQTVGNLRRHVEGSLKEDGTTNPRDAGFRVVLPGAANTRTGYFFRVRSAGINRDNINAGLTSGSYEVQVRLRELQEFAGSLITGTDIRYATNGIHLRGLPAHSPLLGEASEDEQVRNGETVSSNDVPWSYSPNSFGLFGTPGNPTSSGNRPQYIGNVLKSDRGVLSVAGNLTDFPATPTNPLPVDDTVDFYRFSISEQDVVSNANSVASLVFDIDYADGLNRPDTNLSVYQLGGVPGQETWQLIYFGEGSNIAEDQRAPLNTTTRSDFARGSFGVNDPFINTQSLGIGEYLVAVTASALIPAEYAPVVQDALLNVSSVPLQRANSYSVSLLNVTAADNPRLTFAHSSIPTAGGGYDFTVGGVTNTIRGSGFFQLDLTPFVGQFVTINFPAINFPDPPALQPAISGLVVTIDVPNASAERTPFTRISTPQLDSVFNNPLNINTRQEVAFDLAGYAKEDLPAAYFNYNLLGIDYNVTIESSLGVDVPVFLSPFAFDGLDRQAKIDLSKYAGLSNVRLIFTPTGLNPNAVVSRVIIGMAERGEAISTIARLQSDYFSPLFGSGTLQPLFVPNPIPQTTQQTGAYQLEIRRVDRPTITDSNDRDAQGLAIVVPAATSINDGDIFRISDGANVVEFEFNSTGSVQAGRVPINFVAAPVADSSALIAQRIRDAVNNSGVQSRLLVKAAAGDGTQSGTQTGNRVNLFGAAGVSGFFNTSAGNLLIFSGNGDENVNRDQGQIIISGNTIRQSRDYGVWSEAGLADYDPRDLVDTYSDDFINVPPRSLIDNGSVRNPDAIIQARPRTVGSSPGPVRNLQELNDDLIGGFSTGIVVSNNILEGGGLGGVHIAGENPIWMITPAIIPPGDHTRENDTGTHFGSLIDDGDQFFLDSGRTRVGFEFEDIAGAGTGAPNFGSGEVAGNGWRPNNVPVYYREDDGANYLRGPGQAWGYSALETVHALRDAVLGSILVTNGTTQNVTATVAMSLLAPGPQAVLDPIANANFAPIFFDAQPLSLANNPGLNWANRPALYLEGVTNVYYRAQRIVGEGSGFWDIRRVDRAESSQPFARVVNNTIIGNDGRASFNNAVPAPVVGAVQEANDLISNASPTQIGTGATQTFTVDAQIGDNNQLADDTTDVDFYQVRLNAGDRIRVDVDTSVQNQPVNTLLQIYNAAGNLMNLAGAGANLVTFIDNQAAPGEAANPRDPYVDFTAPTTGTYFIAVSALGNVNFNPNSLNGRNAGSGTGDYTINLSLIQPLEAASANDHLVTATQTLLGVGIKPTTYSVTAEIGDNARLSNRAADVDLYQIKLDIGDRLTVDVDTVFNPNPQKSAIDTVLQLYDASGRRVNLAGRGAAENFEIENAAAPGEVNGIDPYLDYVAREPGIYYVAISASGNTNFDPQSSATRTPGVGTGLYDIALRVLQTNEFTITVQSAPDGTPLYNDGDTFTIYQVADLPGTNSNAQVFEFTTDLNVTAGNIPVYIGPGYFGPDVARSIAAAINNSGLNNDQQLDNGSFGIANPLDAVSAVALGGVDGIEPGLRTFPDRFDGFYASLSFNFQGVATPQPAITASNAAFGVGHDRRSLAGGTGSEVFGQGPTVAFGDGNSERFVVIRNAAAVESSPVQRGRSILVDPDLGTNHNLNQLLPETGVLISAGASPTVLNNVFYNVQTPIVLEETRSAAPANPLVPFGQIPLPFGSTAGVDRSAKPGEVIVGGNTYQFAESQTALNRSGFGIQVGPTNIANTQNDFNFIASNNDVLFVNPQAGNYLPATGSRIIDSSIDSLTERDKFNVVKSAVGISPSPIIAPGRDAFGQLRVDDPTVAPPQGLGANVFKDRGALDNADFVGPTARLLQPIDNDSELRDRDPSISYVQLNAGIYPEFRIQLSDIGDSSDPFPGIGIDDDSVLGPNEPPLRMPGTVLTISENGRTLREGVDYVFGYNPTTKEIVLTPLAGVWKNDRVYEIRLNNRNRFVLQALSGNLTSDGSLFNVVDSRGGIVAFEYESGYRLQLPTSLRLLLPVAGGGAGGVADGDQFTISIPNQAGGTVRQVFEMDRNDNSLPGNSVIKFLPTDNQVQLADKILAAIAATPQLGLSPRKLADNSIFLGGPTGSTINVTGAGFAVPQPTVGFQVPTAGPLPGGVTDGQTFTIYDGTRTIVFEIDTDNQITAGNQRVDTSNSSTATDVANQLLVAIRSTPLNVQPVRVGSDAILLNLPSSGSASVGTSRLLLVGVTKSIGDGQSFNVSYAPVGGPSVARTFEFNDPSINASVIPGNTPITISNSLTEEEIGILVADAITTGGLSLQARHIREGNISVGGTTAHTITLAPGSDLTLLGRPGVTPSTSIILQGTLVLAAPASGGAGITDGSTLSISNNGTIVTFEFDNDNVVVPGRIRIPFTTTNTNIEIAGQLAASIQAATALGITPVVLPNGRVDIGFVAADQVLAQPGTGILAQRGNVTDGERFTINNGTTSVSFEFDNTSLNNGRTAGTVPILFSNASTQSEIVTATRTAIAGAGLGLASVTINGNAILLDDTPRFTYDLSAARSLQRTGLPGGAVPVFFVQDSAFTGDDMRAAIIKAINGSRLAGDTNLTAIERIGDTLFVDNVVDIANINGYFLRGVQDLAANGLRANRINNETQFTIVMPGASLDFGDAPDPFSTTSGRYSTLFVSDGARHAVIGTNEVQVVGWTAGERVVGSFTLTHGNQTTTAIPANASAAEVQTALENLSTIGAGNVLVELLEQPSGSANVTYRLVFRGLRESLDVPNTSIVLTPSVSPTTTISTFEQTVVVGQSGPRLGRLINSESDGKPSVAGTADDGDDGVTFSMSIVSQPGLSNAAFNKNAVTLITVTASAPGLLDAWIDFNIDGAWDGPGEQILLSHEFTADQLTKTFNVRVPSTTAEPSAPTRSFARFRFSTAGGLLPTGLAIDGEVEDYDVTIVPGTPPTAVADSFSMAEDQVGGLTRTNVNGLLANDIDPDLVPSIGNSALRVVDSNPSVAGIQPLVAPQFGTLTLNADGSFNYTPNQFFNGVDTFVYYTTDGVLISINPATATITVAEINNPPRTLNQTINWGRDSVYNVTVTEFLAAVGVTPGPDNESSQTLSITRVDPNSDRNGTVSLSGGRVIYTPPTGFSGLDTFTFLVTDNGTSRGTPDPLITTGTVTFSLTDRNDPPTANPDTMVVDEDGSILQPASFFLANDRTGTNRDEAGQTLTFTSIETDVNTRGTVVLNAGNVTYTPPVNFTGTDVFFYNITDNGLNGTGSDVRTARGTVTVTVNSINDRPTITTSLGTVSVSEDAVDRTIDLNAFFGDVDIATANDRLTYTVQSNSRSSLVNPTINASTGVLNLDFLSDQNGSTTIVIRATDLAGAFIDNTLTVNVAAVPDSPRLVGNIPDQNIQEGAAPLDIVVSPNFIFDPDVTQGGDTLTVTVVSNSNTSLVTTQVTGGTLRLSFAANQFGQSTIVVRGTDQAGQSIEDTFVVNVAAVNDPPTVQNRSYTVPANGSLNANDSNGSLNSNPNDNGVLWNSSDIEGDTFNAVVVQQPTRGQLTLNANGTFIYTPNAGGVEGQTDTFTYRAVDSRGAQSNPATVTITFGALNASPHQNPTNRFDVNADGFVSPIDALIIINTLNRVGSNVPISSLTYTPAPYCDVNGDRFLSPIDVLQVINQLNRRSASGEGESNDSAPIVVSPNAALAPQQSGIEVSTLSVNQWVPMQPISSSTGTEFGNSGLYAIEDEESDDENAEFLFETLDDQKAVSGEIFDAALLDILGLE